MFSRCDCLQISNRGPRVNTPAPTHYELLGLEPDATPVQIKTAWRKVLMFAHPDKGAPAGLFRSLEMAYLILADEHQRAMYDRSLKTASTTGSATSTEPETEPAQDGPAAAAYEAPQRPRMTKEAPAKNSAPAPVATEAKPVRFRPGYSHGLVVLVLALAGDLGIIWWAGFPLAAAGALALAVVANLRFRDIRAQGFAFAVAAGLAGYQFGQRWHQLIGSTAMLTLTHLGILALAHALLAVAATAAGYVYGQTVRLNRFLSKKTLTGYRVFGKRGGGRHWQDAAVALETARAVELALVVLPAATVLHGLRVMNGDEALFVDHALLLGDRIVLIQGARLGPGRYTVDAAGHHLCNDRYFPNAFDELPVAAKVVKRGVERRVKVSTLILVVDGANILLDTPDMVAEGEIESWLVEHFGGIQPVVDRLVLRAMAAHLLP